MTDFPGPHGLDDIRSWLRERVAFYLDQPAGSIDADVPLTDYGMNSIYAVSVLADIEDEFDVQFDSVPTWSHPTVNDIAAFLADKLAGLLSTG